MVEMDPGLALSAVEYAIQLAQHIKQTVKAYHENPSKYENLISRFRTIRKSLRIISESDNVDFKSPIWGRAFRRIRDEFEKAAAALKEIHHAIRSSPLLRLFHSKEISQKLGHVEHKIDALQRDLDLLGFFTFSNAASAHQSQMVIHNVQDVKSSLLSLEARLQSMEQKLQVQNAETRDRYGSIPSDNAQSDHESDRDTSHGSPEACSETVRGYYDKEFERPRPHQGIMDSISALQARLKKYAAAVIEVHPSEVKNTILSETCEGLLNQWNLENADIQFLSKTMRHHTSRSAVCEGSMTIRGLWQHTTRKAHVAVKVVLDVEEYGRLDAVLQRVVALREINHPNIVSFYGVCWPNMEEYNKSKDGEKNWSAKYALLVTELMTHNLAEAVKISVLSDFDKKVMILANISRGVEYLHRRGIFRIALTTKHVLLRIMQGEIVGEAKLSSLWSSYEDMRKDQEFLYKDKVVLQSTAPIFHQDTFNFGILMCFVLSNKVDHATWNDRVFIKNGSESNTETVLEQARTWVRGIEPPFLKELAKRCIFCEKSSGPSFTFIRRCLDGFLRKSSLPDLSTLDCGEEIRNKGKAIFYDHEGNGASPEKAVPYFERAVSCGNIAALVNLGNCHFYGLGVLRNVKLGFELFQAAAFAGNAAGQVKLGTIYHSGIPGIATVNILFAAEMYRRAAVQGNPSAQFKLGCYKYNEEEGNPRHLQEAAALWNLAGSAGHRYAQFFIGRCFEEGSGLKRDIAAAKIWYARSAALGHFGGKWALQRLSNLNVVNSPHPPKEPKVGESLT